MAVVDAAAGGVVGKAAGSGNKGQAIRVLGIRLPSFLINSPRGVGLATGAMRIIEEWAELQILWRLPTRRRFPYILVYRLAEHRIEIIAVAHGRRRPGFWKRRLKSGN